MRNLFSNKKRVALFVLILLTLISVLWIFFKTKSQKVETLPTPVPKIFGLLSVAPKNGVDTTIIPTTAIEFMFNKAINPNTIVVSIDPQTEISFESSENRRSVFVRAIPTWEIGTNYTITISVESEEGEKISEIKYPLRLKKVMESDFNEVF